jgi:hypothetical protein
MTSDFEKKPFKRQALPSAERLAKSEFGKWFDEWREKDLKGLGKLIEHGGNIHQVVDFKERLIRGIRKAGFIVFSKKELKKHDKETIQRFLGERI